MRLHLALGFLTALLSSCYNMPVSSQGTVAVLDSAARAAPSTSLSSAKNVSSYNPATKTETLLSGPPGALAGSSVVMAPGSLSIAADLVVEEASSLADTSVTSSLSLNSNIDIKPIGAGLIIRPTSDVTLNQALNISMSLSSSSTLRAWLNKTLSLQSGKNYTVFYKAFIDGELRAGAIPSADIVLTNDNRASFKGFFGAYWLCEVSEPIATKLEVKTAEPIINSDHVSVIESAGIIAEETIVAKAVIPEVKWLSTTMSFDASTHSVKLNASINLERTLSSCSVDFFESTAASKGVTIETGNSLSQTYAIEKGTAHSLFGHFRCIDDQGRLAVSPWSSELAIPAKPSLVVAGRMPFVLEAGKTVLLTGQNFRSNLKMSLNGQALAQVKIISNTQASGVAPSGLSFGLTSLTAEQDGVTQVVSVLYKGAADEIPVSTMPASEICSGKKYYDGSGILQTGTKACAAPIDLCSSDGQISCVTSADYKAVKIANLLPTKIAAGEIIAGVTGTASLESHNACVADGGKNCVVSGAYAAALTSGLAQKVIVGQSAAGISGSVALPLASQVQNSIVFGPSSSPLTGTLALPAANQVLSGITFGGSGSAFTGTLGVPAANQVLIGTNFGPGNATAGTLTLPLAMNVRTSNGAFGVGGTSISPLLTDCSAGNQSACVATGTYKTMDLTAAGTASTLTAANFDTRVSTASPFEFWDANGSRYQVMGSSFLISSQIKNGTTIFGVTGNVTPAPAACSGNGQQSCVASGTFFAGSACSADSSNCFLPPYTVVTQPLKAISYDSIFANQNAILSTATIGGVTGAINACNAGGQSGCLATASYQSMDLTGMAGTSLNTSNFVSTITTNASFQFWDASGSRHSLTGDPDLAPINIANNVQIFTVTGTLTGSPAACSSDGQGSCLVDGSSYRALLLASAADKIVSGQTAGGVNGAFVVPSPNYVLQGTTYGPPGSQSNGSLTLPSISYVRSAAGNFGVGGTGSTPSLADCSYDGDSGCFATGSYLAAFANGIAAKVLQGQTVAGVGGTATAESHSNCGGGGQTGCVAVSSYPTMDLTSASATPDLTTGNFPTLVTSAGSFEFWDSTGTRHSFAGEPNLTPANVKNSVSIFGAFNGDYPSSTHPLAGDSGTADLTNATFNAKIKASGSFEYWSGDGTHYYGNGDTDIAAGNILSGFDIFGESGSFTPPSPPYSWDVRFGNTIVGTTGDLKTNCRNRVNSAIFDMGKPLSVTAATGTNLFTPTPTQPLASGQTVTVGGTTVPTGLTAGTTYYVINATGSTFQLSATNGGTVITLSTAGSNVLVIPTGDGVYDAWDTIDHWNNQMGNNIPPNVVSGWGAESDCHNNVWADVSSSTVCNGVSADCSMLDKLTKLEWSESNIMSANTAPGSTANTTWHQAISKCDNLTFNGQTDWRLPTQTELMEAYIHGITEIGSKTGTTLIDSITNNPNFIYNVNANFWAATTSSTVTNQAYQSNLATGMSTMMAKTSTANFICVRP